MSKIKLLASAAIAMSLATALLSAPAEAGWRRGGFGPGAVAAGIAGAAIGGAIASAPYRDSYAYYGDDYAPGYGAGYAPRYSRGGNTWNSDAGAGGYNTGATQYDYNW